MGLRWMFHGGVLFLNASTSRDAADGRLGMTASSWKGGTRRGWRRRVEQNTHRERRRGEKRRREEEGLDGTKRRETQRRLSGGAAVEGKFSSSCQSKQFTRGVGAVPWILFLGSSPAIDGFRPRTVDGLVGDGDVYVLLPFGVFNPTTYEVMEDLPKQRTADQLGRPPGPVFHCSGETLTNSSRR